MSSGPSGGSAGPRDASGVSRRRVLGAIGVGTGVGLSVSAAGCSERGQSLIDRDSPQQVAVTVGTLPADEDPLATAIARHVADNLTAVGIDAEVVPMPHDQLLRAVLVNVDFDLYVGRFPGAVDPDFLRPLLSSEHVETAGWNNPFGLSSPSVDSLLERQRRLDGRARRQAVYDLQDAIVRLQPFTVVALPDAIRAVREDRFEPRWSVGFETTLEYLSLPAVTDADDGPVELRLTRTDGRITRNLNPVSVEYRNDGTITGLLYDPVGRRLDGRVRPWLADDWEWSAPDADTDADGERDRTPDQEPDGGPVLTVRLRPDLSWHDGTPLIAEDVGFTYRFLRDTSLGNAETAVPAPRFNGHVDVIDRVETVDPRTVRVRFDPCSREVALASLTIPVLPRHVWQPLARPATVAGVETDATVTEALVWSNADPIGSGPLRVETRIEDSQLVLERFDEHFVFEGDPPAPGLAYPVAYDRFVFQVVPADTTAVSLVATGEAAATSSSVAPSTVPRIGQADGVGLLVSPTREFYHVGFNTRRPPLGNYQFRQTVARLLDKTGLVEDAFDGYARPAASPLAGTEFCPPHLEWADGDPVHPFLGDDGALDVATARELFVEAGYQYDDEGRLLAEGN